MVTARLILLLHVCIAYYLKFSRRVLNVKVAARRPAWMDRDEEEEVVNIPTTEFYQSRTQRSLFDSLLTDSSEIEPYSIACMSLADIADSYAFSLEYLGDFVLQMGCRPPLDIDSKLSNYMTGDQIYTLLEAITSLDPNDINEGYDSVQVCDLAEELGLSHAQLVRLCKKEDVNLPYGLESVVHVSVACKIRDLVEMGEYLDDFVDAEMTVEGEEAPRPKDDGDEPPVMQIRDASDV